MTWFNAFTKVIKAFLDIFPDSPIQGMIDAIPNLEKLSNILGYFNYFIPVSTILTITELWLGGITAFYAYKLFHGFVLKPILKRF